MIESVSQQGISPLFQPPLPAANFLPFAANDRAGWWTAAPAGSDVQIAANDTDLTGRAQTNALIADDVYRAEPTPPAGYRVASADDLDRLGITPEMLEQPGSSFRARVYATGAGEATEYVVAFRGSSAGEDWRNNVEQALGLNSESYAKALEIGRQVARSDENVTFTGAGLSDDTIDTARGIATANGRGASAVQAYHVPGEILHLIQEGGDRAAGFLLGGIAGGLLADAPEAYGTQHALPDVRPEGKNFFDGLNPIDRHGMDWVIAGTSALN